MHVLPPPPRRHVHAGFLDRLLSSQAHQSDHCLKCCRPSDENLWQVNEEFHVVCCWSCNLEFSGQIYLHNVTCLAYEYVDVIVGAGRDAGGVMPPGLANSCIQSLILHPANQPSPDELVAFQSGGSYHRLRHSLYPLRRRLRRNILQLQLQRLPPFRRRSLLLNFLYSVGKFIAVERVHQLLQLPCRPFTANGGCSANIPQSCSGLCVKRHYCLLVSCRHHHCFYLKRFLLSALSLSLSLSLIPDPALHAMVAVAASPTPGAAAGSPFATRSHDHPPYKDMVLSALEALKGRKGSSRHAISKYIADNYADLPPTHSSLLTHHLRRLHSKGVIRKFKHSYKLVEPPAAGDSGADVKPKKRGRPRKNAQPLSAVLDGVPKRRGRPPKIGADGPPAKKMKPQRLPKPKTPAVVDPAAVYILPQAEQLKSGFLQSLPGAVAIVLPEGLLSKKTAKSPVLILPNGVQSLVDASAGKKKLGRPKKVEVKKKPELLKVVERRQPGLPRRKAVLPKQVLVHNGDTNVGDVNFVPKKLGRPRKIRDPLLPENGELKSFSADKLAATETELGILEKAGQSAISESVQAFHSISVPELKKRSVGRPKKNVIVEGPKSPRATVNAT